MQTVSEDRPLDEWCKRLIKRGEFRAAEMFARTLLLDNSYKSLILLAKAKFSGGDTAGAISTIDEFLQTSLKNAERLEVLTEKAKFLAELGHLPQALQVLKEATALNTEPQIDMHNSVDYQTASLLVHLGDYEAAQLLFDRFLKIEIRNGVATNTSILQCLDTYMALKQNIRKTSESVENQVLIGNIGTKKAAPKCIYFVSGGLKHCQLFAKRIASQLQILSGTNVHLHLHGVIAGENDPGASTSGWTALKNTLIQDAIPLTFTLANLGLNALKSEEIETAHACERLTQISKTIDAYDCPVIVSSLDHLPMFDPSSLLSEDYDVAVLQNNKDVLDIIATIHPSILILNTTNEARQFAKKLSDYLVPFFSQPTPLLPGLAQAALSLTYKLDNQTIFSLLPSGLIEFDPDNHNPAIAYRGSSEFIGRGPEQSVAEFSSSLTNKAELFEMPLLARLIGTGGHEAYAISLLDNHLAERVELAIEEKFEIFQLKALLLSHLGKLEEAKEYLIMAQRQLPSKEDYIKAKSVSLYQLGSLNAALGNFDEAQEIFNNNIEIGCDNGWTTHTGIINVALQNTPTDTIEDDFSFEVAQNLPVPLNYVYFVAADLNYCEKFASSLIHKLDELAIAGFHFHIHGIALGSNDAGTKRENWKFLEDLLEKTNISSSFTFEILNTGRLNLKQKKSAYASDRFRILPILLEAYQCPIVVADIDQLPLQDPRGIFQNDVDVQLLRFPKSVLNFLSVTSATVSVFHPTANGLEISRRVSAYIKNTYKNIDTLDWHVDQAALTSISYTASDSSKISYFDTSLVEQNPKEVSPETALKNGATFWSVTNSIKGNSVALARHQNQNHIDES